MCIVFERAAAMKKILILLVTMLVGISFNARALVRQPASAALSYNNVYSKKPALKVYKETPQKKEEVKPVPAAKTVDISSSVSKKVSLVLGQELIVQVSEKNGQTWKATYDSSNVTLKNNGVDGTKRKMYFLQRTSKDSAIFFDCTDENGKVIKNKAVYIKAN